VGNVTIDRTFQIRNIKSTAAITISDAIARNKSISVIGAPPY
jgi:hypothetical protein